MGRDIFISGLSCRFPESNDAKELFENLIAKRDMVTSDSRRWSSKINEIPQRFGKIKNNLDEFDNKFFSISGKQAERLDPQQRLLLEVSYEALVDANISMAELRGSKTGVYIGSCGSDAHKGWLDQQEAITGYEHLGGLACILANRLSFFYDLHGPSETIDTACSSSLVAFHRAVSDLEAGVCDCAIVGGVSLILWNAGTYAFHRFKMLSPDGACKSFDQSANGFARAEGIGIVILTTDRSTKYRPYAKVLGTGVNNGGWNSMGITFPSGKMQKELYLNVCKTAGIEPKEVDYIEAHGTGTVAGDGEELEAIYEAYGKENPNLVIGSVKSNMGHTEAVSGIAGLIKTLVCMDQQILAPNLHLVNPNDKLKTMTVATEPLYSWKPRKAAISSFGFGGTNAHVIIENCTHSIRENEEASKFLTLLAHRTKDGLYRLKNAGAKIPSEIPNKENKQKLPYREVLELPDDPEVSNLSDTADKIYIACSGNGSQWKGMGTQLYQDFPVFKETFDECSKAIAMNLYSVVERGFSDALEATVALVAVQISLVELLKSFGIDQNQIGGYFGHSAGEILCSYLDKITNLKETMEIAWIRGNISNQTGDQGLMASVALSKKDAEALIQETGCEGKVYIACVNSPKNVTLSGYHEEVSRIVEQANKKEIFVRVLETYKKAYHSPFFENQRSSLERMLQEKIGAKSVERSAQWMTSVANLESRLFDYKYHVEAVIRPVDFIRALESIPQKSVVLEIGPHSILKSLIKENRPDLNYVSLMKKDSNQIEIFKEGLGKLWKYGVNIQFKSETFSNQKRPPLAVREKLVSWDHSEKFPIPTFAQEKESSHKFIYDLSQENDHYLAGHLIDGKIILPATSYLCAMWDVFRKIHGLEFTDPGTYLFNDLEIYQSIQVESDSKVELDVKHLGKQFELLFKGETIARIQIEFVQNRVWNPVVPRLVTPHKVIDRENFYRMIGTYGYQHNGDFVLVNDIRIDFSTNSNYGSLTWNGKSWVTLLDGVLQSQLMPPREPLKELRVPVRFKSLQINSQYFYKALNEGNGYIPFEGNFDSGLFTVSGIEASRAETKPITRKRSDSVKQTLLKTANDVLYFGRTTIEDKFMNDYAVLTTNYAIELCTDLIQRKNLSQTAHYKKILEAFGRWKHYAPVGSKELDDFRNHPSCIALRIMEDVYRGDLDEFIEKPLAITTQHPEHKNFYLLDRSMSSFQDKTMPLSFLSVVVENMSNVSSNFSEINILEVGAGTGGMTRLIAPYVVNGKYVVTDINESSPLVPDKRLDVLNLQYEKFDLNNHDQYNVFKKHDIDLVLASNSLHTANNIDKMLAGLRENLKDGAFAIIHEVHTPYCLACWGMDSRVWNFEDDREYGLWITQESWLKKFANAGFEVISYFADRRDISTIFLIRKPRNLKLIRMEAPRTNCFDEWAPKVKEITQPTLFIGTDLEQSGVLGFTRALCAEDSSNLFHAVLSDQKPTLEQLDQIERFALKTNVIEKGRLGTPCFTDIEYRPIPNSAKGFHAEFSSPGDFSSYEWKNNPPAQKVLCKSKYSALIFRDIMLASGKINKDAFKGIGKKGYLGSEFSGYDSAGNRYMGIVEMGIADEIDVDKDWILPIPDEMSYEEAATIPISYCTVYYALFDRAKIERGQSILIHAGTGGVGQAAIHVCLSLGCEIFVTCHQSKKDTLKALFPQLDSEKILDSRSTDFEREILRQTKGRGVDIVLNSLAGEKLFASVRCVADGGHFLEIGKFDLMNHTHLDMNVLLKSVTIHGIDLFTQTHRFKTLLANVAEGIRQGIVKPIPRQIYHHTEIEEAFRFMASGKHIGKVLLDMEGLNPQMNPEKFKLSYYQGESDQGYNLITGGLGGFGLALTHWLFKKGARKFVLTGRRGIVTGEQERIITFMRELGAEIILSTKNVGVLDEAKELISSIPGKIKTVFHLAMALDDVLFKKMNSTQWNNTVQAKANGAIYLDQLTRETGVEKFVVFSSVSGRYGVIGQSNYAWGNSVMEEVCKRRSEAGYHALAIQWGAIDNAGFVAMNAEKARMVTQHFGIIPLTDALNFLDDVLVQSFDDYSVMYNTYKLKQSKDQVVKLSSEEVIRQIEKVIKIDLIKGNQNDTLEVLGIDSLQTVEIQTLLIKLMQEVLPLKKISGMKIGELRQLIQDRFDQPAKNDSMKKEVSKENAEVSSSLIRCRNKTTTKNAVYLFLGYGVDEKKLKISSTEKFDVHIAAWEESPNIDLLSSKIFEHIEANGYQKVTFLTHSAGYQIANSVMQKIPGRISQLISISFVKEGVIENLASADADRVSLKVFEERYRDSAVFIEGHLPVEKLKRQLKLLSAAIATSPYLPPDLILQPRGDILCDPKKLGVEIAGTHHVESFDMNEIYSHI